MSRPDRLAAFRAQNQQSHELSNLAANGNGNGPTRGDFLNEISGLQESIDHLNNNVRLISSLHTRSLNTTSSDDSISSELERVTLETRTLSNAIRDKIASLANEPNDEMRANQIKLVKSKFMDAIQEYRRVEQDFSNKSKQRVGRQFKIVKPEATEAEVQQVIDHSSSGTQIFSDAVLSSSYGEARAAYREVQARQQDLVQMETTLAELAQLFNDMAVLVEQQDQTIKQIEAVAIDVNVNTEKGLASTEDAVRIAKAIRRKKWIFFWCCVLVVVILALVLGLYFGLK
ncbi:t-SNARE [Hymenopellis radicata]|nr:t-SNARE [Hymenopellis radicata]